MEFCSFEMALAIAVVFAIVTHWFASKVEIPEPVSIDNRKLADADPPASLLPSAKSSSAPVVGNPEPKSEVNQESVDWVPSTPPLSSAESSSAPMAENSEPKSEVDRAPWKEFDVFLSFRGADTRRGFVSHLYHELEVVRRIKTFKDDIDLEYGNPIGKTLLEKIENSRFAIVVLSEHYAQSSWCLEELSKICDCMKDDSRIIPLFYYVEPAHVKYQKCTFGDAFRSHEEKRRYPQEKMEQWKEALNKVANFSGCNTKEHKTDREVVEAIVELVCKRVRIIDTYRTNPSGDFEQFVATREAMKKVMEALQNGKVIVGVYGMGGVGKTTMVEHVAVEAYKQGLIHHWTMADVMSSDPDLWKIQETLASMLGETLPSTDIFHRAKSLFKHIMRRVRVLIILDNIWTVIELLKIGIPTPEELKSRNSKVILTTRNKDVFSHMKCEAEIPLNTLNDADSWKLFEKNTSMPFESTIKFINDVAMKVARECAGLPIALKAVAKALWGKSLSEWKIAARRPKGSTIFHREDNGGVFKCIKLSYDYLSNNDSKLCFLLCCLFPEDDDIRIEDLLKYGIGRGLFENYQQFNMQEARASIYHLVQSLKDSNLLLDGNKDRRCARMHDVIRDVGLAISLSEDGHRQFFVQAGSELKHWPTFHAHEYYTAISLMRNNISNFPEELVFPKLQILLLQSSFDRTMEKNIEIPVCLFQPLEALRVLDISDNKITLLPSSSNLLTSLHTLCLDRCLSDQNNISLLGQLKQLQILSMREYPGQKLPKEIGKLTKLKLLDLSGESIEIVPSEVIGNLSNLEEFHLPIHFVDWGSSVEGSEVHGNVVEESQDVGEVREETNAFFKELTGLLHLHILKVFMSDATCMPAHVGGDLKWKRFNICISKERLIREQHLDSSSSCDYSRVLTLDITMSTLQKWFIDVVTKKTKKLQYIECPDLCNILKEYDCGRLHKLKHLSVIGPNQKLEELMNTNTRIRNEPVFENLEELHLNKLKVLKELCVGDLPTGSLRNLKLLKVSGCIKLMNALLQSNLLQRLQNLEKLSLEDMDEVKYVFSFEGSELEESTLPKLIEMRLQKLGKLIKIWEGPAPHRIFLHVKILVVSKCHELKYLFTSDVADHLQYLEELSVKVCKGLERVIEASEETVHNKIVLPKLKRLCLKKLHKLTRFYGSIGNATNDEDEENIEFPLLESSDVYRCPIFKSPAKKKLVSVKNKQPVLILLQETGQEETPMLSRRRGEVPRERRHIHHLQQP